MRARMILVVTVATVAMLATWLQGAAPAGAGVGVAVCNQRHWCTVTASGDVTSTASQHNAASA